MQDFPRAARMLCPEEFGASLKTRPKAKGLILILNQKLISETDPSQGTLAPIAKLGLIIPKRLLKKAVSRNAAKRVIRECFRHHRHDLAPGFYVFRLYKKPQEQSLTLLKESVRQDCEKLIRHVLRSS
ncbi:ribonuclease P protein component [Orrella sp. 11846]|uniref:ribonuclease P protein component n=1 Tax=Orrella sp. 11846 TaxID=3409913 RepID=UPI003B5933E8